MPTQVTSPQPQQPQKPNYNAFSSFTSPSNPASKPSTPAPVPLAQLQNKPQQAATTPQSDPFAMLVSPSSRPTSPPHPGTKVPTQQLKQPSSLVDLTSDTNGASADDEWTFTSSLPETFLPNSSQIRVHSSAVAIDFFSERKPTTPPSIHITASFSNSDLRPIAGLHFQLAVEKVGIFLLY